jgi:hypothetical protein
VGKLLELPLTKPIPGESRAHELRSSSQTVSNRFLRIAVNAISTFAAWLSDCAGRYDITERKRGEERQAAA